MQLNPDEARRLELIRQRSANDHIPRQPLTITIPPQEKVRVLSDVSSDEEVVVNDDDVPPGQASALSVFMAHAGPDVHFLLGLVLRAQQAPPPVPVPTPTAVPAGDLEAVKQVAWEGGATAMRASLIAIGEADTDGLVGLRAIRSAPLPDYDAAAASSGA